MRLSLSGHYLTPHFKLAATLSPKSVEEREYMSQVPYASAVSNLMYAMVCTKPDLSHAVSMVTGYRHDPEKGHWKAMKWILGYIRGIVEIGLVFEKDTRGKESHCVWGTLTPTTQERLINTGQQWDMYSRCHKHM